MAFDAPSRETCVARRARTNTPLQALVLMNDEQYVEAARSLAARMLNAGPDPTTQLTLGFQLCTARIPTEQELTVVRRIHEQHLEHYRSNAPEADKLLAVGTTPRPELPSPELAAMTMTANLLLNLDEMISRE